MGRGDLVVGVMTALNQARAGAGRSPHLDDMAECDMMAALLDGLLAPAPGAPAPGAPAPGDLAAQLAKWASTARSVQDAVADLTILREVLHTTPGLHTAPGLYAVFDAAMISVAESMTSRLAEEALLDPLTELGNRRALDFHLDRAVAMMGRSETPISVVSVDLDGLKQINDTQGHQAGDEALTGLAHALNVCLRDADGAYRVGGDEFVVVLIGTPPGDVATVMDRVVAAGAPRFSWGVASAPMGLVDHASVVEAADRQLYERRRHERRPSVAARLASAFAPVRSGAKLTLAAAAGAAIALALAVSQSTPAYPPMGLAPNAGGPIPNGGGSSGVAPTSGASGRSTGTATGGSTHTAGRDLVGSSSDSSSVLALRSPSLVPTLLPIQFGSPGSVVAASSTHPVTAVSPVSLPAPGSTGTTPPVPGSGHLTKPPPSSHPGGNVPDQTSTIGALPVGFTAAAALPSASHGHGHAWGHEQSPGPGHEGHGHGHGHAWGHEQSPGPGHEGHGHGWGHEQSPGHDGHGHGWGHGHGHG